LYSDVSRARRTFQPASAALLARLLLLILALSLPPAAAVATVAGGGDFSGDRAMHWLEYQCALGHRSPGSPGHAALRTAFVAHSDSLGLAISPWRCSAPDPAGGEDLQLCNYVISAGPRGGRRLWIGAHYDTRPVSDHDPDPELARLPLAGANDGASGVAVLLHLAELLAADPPPIGVDLIFFDGEDSGLAGEPETFCLGSARMAAELKSFGNPLAAGDPLGLILLDMVGEKNLEIPMESISLSQSADWTRSIFARAADLGLDAFIPVPGRPVFDDHVPFLRAGIPAVDLIDFEFPQWHTSGDVPSVCSPASLEQVGALMLDLIRNPPY